MGKTLLIVESPAKCKKIESYLGNGYTCIASFGHIRELAKQKGLGCIDIENNYKPTFINVYRQKNNIETLRKKIQSHDDILLATDDDREGEAIAWHICMVFKLPVTSTKRIIFHEITKDAILNAVRNPTVIDMNKVHSQQARQVLDFLVGYTISPMLWKYINAYSDNSLSAGRCQTPALRLIYDNYLDTKNNVGKECYSITGYFTKKGLPFVLNTTIDTKDKCETFLEENVNFNHTYTVSKPREIVKKAPEPLTTSSLQQKSSNELHYSPKQTMMLAQNLYEAGYITYMRTDSKFYSVQFVEQTKQYIHTKFGDDYIKANIQDLCLRKGGGGNEDITKPTKKKGKKTGGDKEGMKAQEAHEAIRPTDVFKKTISPEEMNDKIGEKEKRLYEMIWKYTVESCMSDAIFNSITASVSAPSIENITTENTSFQYSEEQVVFKGWCILENIPGVNELYAYLKNLKSPQSMKYKKIKCDFTIKDLKQHYTEAKLVSLLEKHGIGRPSTFSTLITKIQDRGYVKKDDVDGREIECVDFTLVDDVIEEIPTKKKIGNEKNKLVIQPLGILVIEYLLKSFPELFDYSYTKQMEDDLDVISEGRKIWHSLCGECYTYMMGLKEKVDTKEKFAIQVDEDHKFKIAKYGAVLVSKDKETGKDVFQKVKPNIDIDAIRNGTLKVEDIIQPDEKTILCVLDGEEIELKKGKFGNYFTYKGKNYSLKGIKKNVKKLTESDIREIVDDKQDSGVVREINEYLSIRNGKYGHYILYKKPKAKKPEFLKLKGFTSDYLTCPIDELIGWIRQTYTL